MKKIKVHSSLILLLLTIILTKEVNAQRASIGLKGGINYSALNIPITSLDKNKNGYHFGGFVNVPVTDKFSLQPEFLYSSKGAEVNYGFFEFLTGSIALNLKYLDVPLMAQYKINELFYIEAGPYASILLGSAIQHKSSIPFLTISKDINKDFFNSIDYGLSAGAGVSFGKIGAGIRYNYGLNNVGKSFDILGTNVNLTNAKNTVWQLSLSYKF